MTDAMLLQTTARILAIGLLFRALERFGILRECGPGGLLEWRNPLAPRRGLFRFEPTLSRRGLAATMLVTQAACAGGTLVVPVTHPATPWLAIGLAVSTLFCTLRLRTIGNASDVMYLMVQGGVVAGAFDGGDGRLHRLALTFIGLQAAICYVAAAASKLRSPLWRRGRMMSMLFRESRYRRASVGALLGRVPAAGLAVTWSVIVVEAALGVAAFLPQPLMLAAMATGVAFHLAIAVLMRLYSFFWAFTATYPAIYFLHAALRRAF